MDSTSAFSDNSSTMSSSQYAAHNEIQFDKG